MIPNVLNVVLGLALVYVAVLAPWVTARRSMLLAAVAVIMFVAAWLARRSDYHRWQNNTNMVLAALLALQAVLRLEQFPLAVFWIQFSVGTLVAVLALWAVVYRPDASPT
ncbi:MAG TPA: hypothetical protein VGR86_06395 [Steroidobacteraceae bacterium]|nr:hypothetical protein [Steroidobacteraceae bacterium]HEV2441321.1 hypothetical protein [Steroidobacteraceae bacterium]